MINFLNRGVKFFNHPNYGRCKVLGFHGQSVVFAVRHLVESSSGRRYYEYRGEYVLGAANESN